MLVRLTTKDGKEIAQAAIRVSSTEWKKQKAVLTATADAADAVLSVCPQMAGKYALDMVSLSHRIHLKAERTGCAPIWHRPWPTFIPVLSVSPADVWLTEMVWTIFMIGKAL